MPTARWKSQIDASQADNLQLIMNALLGVQILSALRDPIVIGLELPGQLIVFNIVLTAVLLGLALWVRLQGISPQLSNKIVLFGLICTGAKAIASIAAQGDPPTRSSAASADSRRS